MLPLNTHIDWRGMRGNWILVYTISGFRNLCWIMRLMIDVESLLLHFSMNPLDESTSLWRFIRQLQRNQIVQRGHHNLCHHQQRGYYLTKNVLFTVEGILRELMFTLSWKSLCSEGGWDGALDLSSRSAEGQPRFFFDDSAESSRTPLLPFLSPTHPSVSTIAVY